MKVSNSKERHIQISFNDSPTEKFFFTLLVFRLMKNDLLIFRTTQLTKKLDGLYMRPETKLLTIKEILFTFPSIAGEMK